MTMKECFNKFPEPYRTQALINFEKNYGDTNPTVVNIRSSLEGAFIWANSPEGSGYWEKFYHSLIVRK